MYQLSFSQHGLEQLKVPASTDVREAEAAYRFLARIAAPLQRLHEEIQRIDGEKVPAPTTMTGAQEMRGDGHA
jgi:hypothetical protein